MPAAGYSLRKLTPNAINCIRVRRSNDNAEQDIGFINSKPNAPINTGQLLQFVGGNNGFVTTWYDQSTNARNATQTTGGNQLRVINGGVIETLNSLPALNTYGANTERNFVTSYSNLQSLPVTILSIFKIDTLPSNGFNDITFHIGGTSGGGGSGRYQQWTDSTNNNSSQRQNAVNAIVSESATVHKIFASYFTNSNAELRLNGVDATPVAYSGTIYNSSSNYVLVNAGQGNTQFHGAKRFQEQIIYQTDLHSQRILIETNINQYYNVF
jgi:hypothetical protein